MKKVSIILSALLMAGMMSCDKAKDDGNGFYNNPIPTPTSDKVVLLEDYTGVKCINCPAAAQTALELQNLYGHKLIVLSVHAGDMSSPAGNFPDFLTEAGTAWYNNFGFKSNPIGTVNRLKKDGGWGFNDGDWSTAIAAALLEEPVAKLTISSDYDTLSRNLEVEVGAEFLNVIDGNYYVTICLMEDSIIGRQLFPSSEGGMQEDYVHRHVMRGTLNGTWGEQIYKGAVAYGDVYSTKKCKMTIDSTYDEDQCYIIAYVYDENQNKMILQAGEKKVKE